MQALGTFSPKSLLILWRYQHLTAILTCIFLMISDTEHLTCSATQNSDGLARAPSREQRTRLPATQRKSPAPWLGKRRSKSQNETGSHPFAGCKEDTCVCVCVSVCVCVCVCVCECARPTAPANDLVVPLIQTIPHGDRNKHEAPKAIYFLFLACL